MINVRVLCATLEIHQTEVSTDDEYKDAVY